LYSEVGGGAFLIASLYFAVSDKPYRSGLALALSILFRPTNLVALPFLGWVVWRKGLKALPSAIAIAIGGILLAAYNWARFGSPLNFGYTEGNLSVPFFTGPHAMFLSPGRSLFVYSPILLLAIPGAWFFFQTRAVANNFLPIRRPQLRRNRRVLGSARLGFKLGNALDDTDIASARVSGCSGGWIMPGETNGKFSRRSRSVLPDSQFKSSRSSEIRPIS
jgi:hypothetical protein